jgi:hypothetical protein
MSAPAPAAAVMNEVLGMQDVMQKILGHLDVAHLHVLGQATKSLRKLCFNKLYFSKFSNQNWESRGDSGGSVDIKDIQRLCSVINKFDHLSFIRTLDLWLEDFVAEHCAILACSLHHVSNLRLCCEQLCDLSVLFLTSGFKLLHACHLITCPLLTPQMFIYFQSLPSLTTLRLESCSGIKSHPLTSQMLQQTVPMMTSLRCLELNDSVSPSNAELFAILSFCVSKAPQPLRAHCHPKSCIDEPMFQSDFHRDFCLPGLVSFFCADCGQVEARSERYITWFAETCCLRMPRTGCEFLVFAFSHHDDRAVPSSSVILRTCTACSASSRSDVLSFQLDDGYFHNFRCPPLAIPIRAELNCTLQPDLAGFSCMRREDGVHIPKTKSRQRQLWYACM